MCVCAFVVVYVFVCLSMGVVVLRDCVCCCVLCCVCGDVLWCVSAVPLMCVLCDDDMMMMLTI